MGELLALLLVEEVREAPSDLASGDGHRGFPGIARLLAHLRDGVPVHGFFQLGVLQKRIFFKAEQYTEH